MYNTYIRKNKIKLNNNIINIKYIDTIISFSFHYYFHWE